MAENSVEPGGSTFVVLENGEKIQGAKLKRNRKWSIDGKEIDPAKVKAYQDKSGYAENGATRIINGKKLSMYYYVQDNSRMQSTYNSGTNTFKNTTTGGTATSFYMKRPGGDIEGMTYNSVKKAVQDCPAAVDILEKQFKGTYTQRNPDWKTNDYPKLIKVLDAYNNTCP
jgi:hypothetical protein